VKEPIALWGRSLLRKEWDRKRIGGLGQGGVKRIRSPSSAAARSRIFDALIETAPIAAEVFHDPDHTR
jgi:hypothetical protein